MSLPKTRRWWFVSLLALPSIGEGPSSGQAPARWVAPTSLGDPRLESLRGASVSWETRSGPDRLVVDQVCLVPDLPGFLEAISAWDESHYFPILLDDVETSFRFIRAFQPARIVRLPRSATPIPTGELWARAVRAVGASWSSESGPISFHPAGDSVPKGMGATPPGVVLSSPTAPMLAGAVALAAGRFQPLLRLDDDGRFADVLTSEGVEAFAGALAEKVGDRVPNFGRLGDDCDFLTVAGDWPYRYRDPSGQVEAVDDRLGRPGGSDSRWAFAGRLLGGPPESVYRAMCSLFLQPESALMFNGYVEDSWPWSEYATRAASTRLDAEVPTSQVSGETQADLEGWHETFGPISRFGLALINSHGSPSVFHVRGGPASVADIPRSVPSAVLMIHSYSAADPADPSTIAGRWLANGAFAFFGSINEPYLNAFRTPQLVGDLIGEGLPLVAAARGGLVEPYGQPWRLVFLGDPLFRLRPRSSRSAPRVANWPSTAPWPAYEEGPAPLDDNDLDRHLWATQTALNRLQGGATNDVPADDLVDALLAIRRSRLPTALRPAHDALLIEVLLQGKRRSALGAKIAEVPEAERSPALHRAFEGLVAAEFHRIVARKDASKARAAWRDLIEARLPREFKEQATARVGRLAETPGRRRDWYGLLRATLESHGKSPEAGAIRAELERVAGAMKDDH